MLSWVWDGKTRRVDIVLTNVGWIDIYFDVHICADITA